MAGQSWDRDKEAKTKVRETKEGRIDDGTWEVEKRQSYRKKD